MRRHREESKFRKMYVKREKPKRKNEEPVSVPADATSFTAEVTIGSFFTHVNACNRAVQVTDLINMAISHNNDKLAKLAVAEAHFIISSYYDLVEGGSTYPLLFANVGFYLGKLLEHTMYMEENLAREIQHEILRLICRFPDEHCREFGAQLAKSSGVGVLLELFSSGELPVAYERAILGFCNASYELCLEFKNAGCIRKIVQAPEPRSKYMYKMLLCFAESSWYHGELQRQGALDILVDRLSVCPYHEKELIVNVLHQFVESDTYAIPEKFVDVALAHISVYLECNKKETKDRCAKGLVTFQKYIATAERQSLEYNLREPNPFHWICNPSFPAPSSEAIWFVPRPADCEEESYAEFMKCTQNPQLRVVVAELYLLGCLLNGVIYKDAKTKNSVEVIYETETVTKIFNGFLRYIAEAPMMPPVEVQRIFRQWRFPEERVRAQIPTCIQHCLLLRKCPALRRWNSKCGECRRRIIFGGEMLLEFSFYLSNSYLLDIMQYFFKQDDQKKQINGCIAMMLLMRRTECNWEHMLATYQPIQRLFAKLREILMDSNFEKNWQITTYENGPTLLYQIFVVLSPPIPYNDPSDPVNFSEFLRKNSSAKCDQYDPNIVGSDNAVSAASDSSEFITFTCGDLKEIVPKKRLCEASEYFRVMLCGGFSEQFRDTFEYNEEKEQCTFEFFRSLLRLACGYFELCLDLTDDDLPTLLNLAERYVCSSVTSLLLSPDGPFKSHINGKNLPTYLNVMLTTAEDNNGVLRDGCMNCLLRNCTEEERFDALKLLAGDPVATNAFLKKWAEFLRDYGLNIGDLTDLRFNSI